MKSTPFLTFLFLLFSCSCTDNKPDDGQTPDVPAQDGRNVTAYVTTADAKTLFKKTTFDFTDLNVLNSSKILYDKSAALQEVDGFGLAITTATCYNLMRMSRDDRTAFLTQMFSPTEGVGSSLVRVSIGASDFCLQEEYTWCDTPGLENFAVHEEDRQYLFPVLKEIYAINPDVKIIGSPWSCPKWMKGAQHGYEGNDPATLEKDFDSWTSGRLKPSCYQAYAEYFVKWIKVMEGEGFDIHAVTMQNEPLNHGNSMSMFMPWTDQRDFIKVLGPALQENGLGDVRILLFDHNYNYDGKASQLGYPLHIYNDEEASKWAHGSAWHSYGGSVTELDQIIHEYPDKSVYFTEASIGEWNYNFSDCLINDFRSIFLGTLRRNGRGVTLWNLMLDENNKPYSPQDGSCKTCYGGVTIDSKDYRTITRNSHWYNVAHASAVVRPGARRIETSGYTFPSGLECLMFANPDGTVAALILNTTGTSHPLVFANDGFTVKFTAPARSIASLIWKE